MAKGSRLNHLFLSGLAAFFMGASSLALSETGSPGLAGQVCPQGSYVIGFDSSGNILCSDVCGNLHLENDEECDDGNNRDGDGCSANCESESRGETPPKTSGQANAVVPAPEPAAAEAVAREPDAAKPATAGAATDGAVAAEPATAEAVAADLVIQDVEPRKVVYGTPNLKITITGEGFGDQSVIVFDGKRYEASVNESGTRLETTLVTGDLIIGRYAIKVHNGPGNEATLKKAIYVY